MSDERVFKVEMLARVEGEGRYSVRVSDGVVTHAELSIFEAPRYFEALLRGRQAHEVPDIVARICGICPVAYQMSSVRALESALAVKPTTEINSLRRLLYCGEWIESHVLHIFLLHAPDYLGYASAIEMAADHREIVERGLRMKKAGNHLLEVLGGRAIHPVSVKLGGFSRAPTKRELEVLRESFDICLGEAIETVTWASRLDTPAQDNDYTFVAVDGGDDYPLEYGETIAISGRASIAVDEFNDAFRETHVAHSNALQCRLADGHAYLCGPLARLNLFADTLHPTAAKALAGSGLRLPIKNPYQSITVRAIEVVHAFAEALDLIDSYRRPTAPFVDCPPRAARGHGATEAPRGLLYHRYDLAADGSVIEAQIVPPTSQNQARIEEDLISLTPSILELPHPDATRRCEQLIRAYDPCISCATHFLTLDIERVDGQEGAS